MIRDFGYIDYLITIFDNPALEPDSMMFWFYLLINRTIVFCQPFSLPLASAVVTAAFSG
jgi:hypothetical protein